MHPDATVLALGGASWPRDRLGRELGGALVDAGVDVRALRPANSGFDVAWSAPFRERFAGQPLKNLRIGLGDDHRAGEAVVTDYGVESGVFYALGATLRDAIERDGHAVVDVDLHPDRSESDVARLLATRRSGDSHQRVAAAPTRRSRRCRSGCSARPPATAFRRAGARWRPW